MNFVPASVKAASERSDDLIKGLNGAPEKDGQAKDEPVKANAEDTPVTPDADKKDDQDKSTLHEPKPSDDFETKYRTLQGKYNAEIPRLNDKVRTLTQTIASLTDENASLKAGKNNNEDPQMDGRLDPNSYDEYGEEFSSLAAKVNSLIDENNSLKEQIGAVTQSQGKTDYEQYMGRIKNGVAQKGVDFDKLNADPDFLTWLQEIVPYTGQSRHTSLQTAERNLDIATTMGIFNEYLGLNPPKQQKQQKEQSKPKATPNFQPSHKPSGSDTKPPMSQSEKIWTRQDVNNMYRAKANGDYKGRDAEFKALEADMFAAQTEGRFR